MTVYRYTHVVQIAPNIVKIILTTQTRVTCHARSPRGVESFKIARTGAFKKDTPTNQYVVTSQKNQESAMLWAPSDTFMSRFPLNAKFIIKTIIKTILPSFKKT